MRLLVSLALVAAAAGPESPAALRARARAAYGQGGGLKASMDYFHAALIYQHSLEVEDTRKAHELCLKAIELESTKRDGKWVVYTVDPAVTDEERARWNVPPLAEAMRRAEQMNAARP